MDADAGARTVIVVAGGTPIHPGVAAELPDDALVIAADSGVDHAHTLGLRVDVVVGDLDSVSPAGLRQAEAAGATVERHPCEKDRTDLELALDAAVARGAVRIVVAGGHGGRIDMNLANLLVLASPAYERVAVDAFVGCARLHVVRGGTGRVTLRGLPGEVVTLLPIGGPALSVRTDGLRYPLDGETLLPGSTRGCSNELVGTTASVVLDGGTLLCVLPREER